MKTNFINPLLITLTIFFLVGCGGTDSLSNTPQMQEENPSLDKTAPIITLHGKNIVIIKQYSTYKEEGASAIDGDKEISVKINGSVDISKIGDYIITYIAEDNSGNIAKKDRIVHVVSKDLQLNTVISFQDKEHGFEPWKISFDSDSQMIKDINTVPAGMHVSDGDFIIFKKITYFFADDGSHGYSLYRTDGTDSGTWMVKDIFQGDSYLSSSYSFKIDIFEEKMYFRVPDGSFWKSDGTKEGTKKILDNLSVLNIAVMGNSIYLDAKEIAEEDEEYQKQLYRYDGVSQEAVKLTNFKGYGATNLTPFDGKLYFRFYYIDSDDGTYKKRLFRYDPAIDDLFEYKDTYVGNVDKLFVFKNSIFRLTFEKLYKLDTDGTFKLITIFPKNSRAKLIATSEHYIYIQNSEDYVHYLYRSDGKTDIYEKVEISYYDPVYMNNVIYFIKKGEKYGSKSLLMRWDESSSTAVDIFEFDSYSLYHSYWVEDVKPMLKVVDNRLYFIGYNDKKYKLYESDGSTVGTKEVSEVGKLMIDIKNCNNKPCLLSFDASYGNELWIYNGVLELVKDINTKTQDSVFQEEHEEQYGGYGYELTQRANSIPSKEYFKVGNLYYFIANINANTKDERDYHIFRTDTTVNGTFSITDTLFGDKKIAYDVLFSEKDGMLYFIVKIEDSSRDLYLCKSDGTKENTKIVKKLTKSYQAFVDDLINVKGELFFNAPIEGEDKNSYYALYKIDSEDEIKIVKELPQKYGYAYHFQTIDNKLYFLYLNQLWESDGTTENTKVIFENSYNFPNYDIHVDLMKIKNDLYLISKDIDKGGLWKLAKDKNSTNATTILQYNSSPVYDKDTGLYISSNEYKIVDYSYNGDELYIILKRFNDTWTNMIYQLAKLNTTTQKVEVIKSDFCNYDSIKNLIVIGGKLYFAAEDEVHGKELWVSDGTDLGTHILKDIMLGKGSSNPHIYEGIDNQMLLFMATDKDGAKLWISDGSKDGTIGFLNVN